MKWLCCRGKEVGVIVSLFVEVDVYMWEPLVVDLKSLLRFDLRAPGPVPVQVEEIVIRSSARPGFAMLFSVVLRIGGPVTELVVKICVAIATVGINTRVDDHNCV